MLSCSLGAGRGPGAQGGRLSSASSLPNIVVLVADSLRADRLSCYGHFRETSPFLDSLAAAGARFERFFTPGTPTHPACASLFTGQLPVTHRIVARKGHNDLSDDAPWFPEILARRGYETAALDNLARRRRERWFARGFGSYINLRTHDHDYLSAFQLNHGAFEWLRKLGGRRPFLLYIRYGDPHTPYTPPHAYRDLFYRGDPTTANTGSLDAFYGRSLKLRHHESWLDELAREWPGARGSRIEDLEFVRAQYDAEIRALDDGIRELLDEFRRLGALEDTVFLVLGDHGEELGDHGEYFGHTSLYDTVIRPPLLVYGPGIVPGGRCVEALTQTADLAPTILELASAPIPEAMDGRSLRPLLDAETDTHAYTHHLACQCTVSARWAFLKGDHKLIVTREDAFGAPPYELYDLRADPDEQRDIAAVRPELRDALATEFEDVLAGHLRRLGRDRDPLVEHGTMLDSMMRRRGRLRKAKRILRNGRRAFLKGVGRGRSSGLPPYATRG